MSNRSQRSRPPSQRREHPAAVAFRAHLAEPALDLTALAAISRYAGSAWIDGSAVAIVIPLREPDDHADFDSAICRAGLTTYLRPRLESDRIGQFVSHMMVRELSPGIRVRTPIEFFVDGALN